MTTSAPPVENVAPGMTTRVPAGALAGSRNMLLGVGVVALGASLILAAVNADWRKQFYYSYLVAYMFVLSLALGAMFFVLIQHLSRAGWSVVVRRVAENMMGTMPLMVPLFIPIAVGYGSIYHWTHPDPADVVLEGKSAYLNTPFFFIRAVCYLIIWTGIAAYFRRTSIKQDENGDPALTMRMARVAAPCMFLFALSLTFAAIDWMMSIESHWFSTIWGVYYFAGCFLSFLALLSLTLIWLQKRGHLTQAVTTEHFHDVGKLMFGFVVFWTYIGFSQYMLIWYANLPEETVWYLHRREGSWLTIGAMLIVGHFLVPFAFLMSRHVKRRKITLGLGAAFLLVMHWFDLHWIVMPTLQHHGFHPHVLDLVTIVGAIGLFLWLFLRNIEKTPLLPERDPRLAESLNFVNH